MEIANNITELIGKTPLMKINNFAKNNIYAKLESFNPTGSAKDRPALYIIKNAEDNGLVDKDTVIIEATSGNFGISLAMICAIKGYKLIITMPDNMSPERIKLMSAYGAEVVLTNANLGMQGSIDKAIELSKKYPKTFMPQQFDNISNPQSHENTTAQEIWNDTNGQVDIVVAGVGTGGTISGISKFLKGKKSDIKACAVEPECSQVLIGEKASKHKIQGIGANFIPKNYCSDLIDEIIPVSDEDAIETTKKLAQKEGLLCGISSGACMHAAIKLANKYPTKLIVAILPDTGERYLSSNVF